MKLLFSTQNNTLDAFEGIRSQLASDGIVSKSAFLISDSWYYHNWLKKNSQFENQGHVLLKEWELTAKPFGKYDMNILKKYETELGQAMFTAMRSDRRIIMGPDCAFTQDYRSRFSDDDILWILQHSLQEIDKLLTTFKPDVIVGFICVTFCDSLLYLFAKARNIKFLNLRPTRIGDCVTFASNLVDPSPEFTALFRKIEVNGSNKLPMAVEYLQKVRQSTGRYEGVVAPSKNPARKLNGFKNPIKSAARQIRNYLEYRNSPALNDNHVPDPLRQLFFAGIVNPIRARYQFWSFREKFVNPRKLDGQRFAFFPLHAEPEISLLVYARPFLNQIEVIRAFAESLPVDMILLVKEHPWMVGKRKNSYFEKLLNIPRVRLVSPTIKTTDILPHADLITVISGSVALEAIIHKKPAITLGEVPFNILPQEMIIKCSDLSALPAQVKWLLENHKHEEEKLTTYVATVLESSENIQLYSTILSRVGAHKFRETNFETEIKKLSAFLVKKFREFRIGEV
jgi:hypothetical protein